jgi:hypothetical protein
MTGGEVADQHDEAQALLMAVASGGMPADRALDLAGNLPPGAALDDRAAQHWIDFASALVGAGRWQEAFAVARLVENLAGRPGAEWTSRYATDLRLGSFAVLALRILPHPHLYALAMETAAAAIEQADANSDDLRGAEARYARASLRTGVYISLQSLDDIEVRQRIWRESLAQQLGARQAETLRARYGDLPDLDTALREAESDLLAARRTGHPGLAAAIESRLAEVLLWRFRLADRAGQPDQPDLRARCAQHARAALAATDIAEDPAGAALLLNTLAACGAAPDAGALDSLLRPSLDERSNRLARDELMSLIQQLANLLLEADPARGLALLHEAKPIIAAGPESVRLSCWMKELLLIAALAGARYPFGEDLIAAVDADADARIRGARMIAAAFALTALGRPREALQMVERFERVAPVLAGLHDDAIGYLRIVIAELLFLAEWQRSPAEAATRLVAMLDFCTSHRLADRAANAMYQMSLLASVPAAVPVLLEGLRTGGLRAVSFLGDRGAQQLIGINNRALAALYNDQAKSAEVWLHLLQQVAGARFSTALAAGIGYRLPPGGEPMLVQLRQLAQAGGDLAQAGGDTASESASDSELLTAYVSDEAELPGGDAAQVLANLRHRFDWLINQDLGERAAGQALDRLYLDEVGSTVGTRTAVLHLLTLDKPDGSTIIIGTCITSAGITIDGHESSFPGAAGGQQPMSPLGAHVRELRRLVRLPADGPLPVPVEAAAILADDLTRLLPQGCLRALAQASKDGQDHLLIVPHGPLHYYPLHLLGPVSAPLCDSWKISYLPTLAALGPRRAPNIFDAGRTPMTAIGLGFADRPEIAAKLPGAALQAREIAAVFGCEPLAEAAATKGRVLAALRTSRRVHLATHGRNNVTAPAFQSVLVTPGSDGSEGEIAAWEIGELDLRGLEIVTTAACETGLGRFDVLGNLRGLPASLYLAGVQSIATTLWPVGVDSSRVFFTTFYSRLRAGESRIDSFAAAQRETRSRSPEYRWWAGYTLSGSWT